jgi:hypothetical protein
VIKSNFFALSILEDLNDMDRKTLAHAISISNFDGKTPHTSQSPFHKFHYKCRSRGWPKATKGIRMGTSERCGCTVSYTLGMTLTFTTTIHAVRCKPKTDQALSLKASYVKATIMTKEMEVECVEECYKLIRVTQHVKNIILKDAIKMVLEKHGIRVTLLPAIELSIIRQARKLEDGNLLQSEQDLKRRCLL